MAEALYPCGVCGGTEHEGSLEMFGRFPHAWQTTCKTCGLVTRCDLKVGKPKPQPPKPMDPYFDPFGFFGGILTSRP